MSVVKTTVFISSVAQDSLRSLRGRMWENLNELGHEPFLFERNFGAWDSHRDPVRTCIECVGRSDVFLLFIGNKAGTFNPQSQRTVTHLELIEACRLQKTILAYVDSTVKAEYFSKARRVITDFEAAYEAETGTLPQASQIMDALKSSDASSHVDPYVWFFLHDLMARNLYFEDLDLAVAVDWKMVFSDLLRRGLQLMPLKDDIVSNEQQLEQHEQFYDILTHALPHVNVAGLHHIPSFLEAFRRSIPGDTVVHDYGYVKEPVGSFANCSAVTLYECVNNRLVFRGKTGSATEIDYFSRNDKTSFVTLTFNNPVPEDQVFFRESKRMFYFCLRLPNHVMTFHLPCGPEWTSSTFVASKDNIVRVILKKNAMAFDFVRLLIGGMQRGSD